MTENLVSLLLDRAGIRPDLKIGTVDDQVTIGAALRRAAGGAQELASAGLDGRSRAAIVATTSTDYMIVWMACLVAGVPVALVNPTYPGELLAQMLENLGPEIVFTDLEDESFAGQRLVSRIDSAQGWQEADPATLPGRHADRHAIASFMHTSGTTGVPKFCAQTHEYFLRLGSAMAEMLQLSPEDRMLAPLPLFHINPMGYGIIAALTAGADALTVSRFSASGFWPTVRDNRITAVTLHAPPVEILKRATSPADSAGHSLRTMFYADGEFMARFGIPHAVSGYGSTEAAGVSHLHAWSLGDDIPSNASRYGGRPRADIEDDISPSGEIMVREREAGALFAGYFADGQLNPSRSTDGWFATGDLGRRDDSGGLVFLERAAESIRVKGEFVPIPYVEEQLGAVTELDDLALWKTAGSLVDDEVVLYIVSTGPAPLEAIRRVTGQLPAFMRPSHVALVRAIPRDAAAGKVQRRLLDDQEVISWTSLT